MRALFGLVSLLICGLIIAYAWASYTQETASVAVPLQQQAVQLSGRSADGTPVGNSIQTEAAEEHGRLKGLRVIDVTLGGGMQAVYGLQKDDVIVSVGELTVNELNTESAMKEMLASAYQRSASIVVIRDGKKLTLPLTPGAALEPPAGSVQNQVNSILKQSQP